MMPRARIKLLILALAAAAAVHAFAPVRVQQRPTLLPRARATTGPAGSGSDGALVMSAAAASSGGYSGGSISNRPTAGGGAATRPLKRRAPVSNTYCECCGRRGARAKRRICPHSSPTPTCTHTI